MQSSSMQTLLPASAVAGALGLLLVGITATPAYADSIRSRQWHLDAMHAEEMWKISTGRGITVAVIDSGVGVSVADLKSQLVFGKDN
jgi:subtilisin family serine protease